MYIIRAHAFAITNTIAPIVYIRVKENSKQGKI